MLAALHELTTSWGSIYANNAAIRSAVAFAHVAALIVGGGIAIAADRTTLRVSRTADEARRRWHLDELARSHRIVVLALVLIAISGGLLFASDFDTFAYSKFFWIKMLLVAALVANGTVLRGAERRAAAGDPAAWSALRTASIASLCLWLATTLGGVVLPNIG